MKSFKNLLAALMLVSSPIVFAMEGDAPVQADAPAGDPAPGCFAKARELAGKAAAWTNQNAEAGYNMSFAKLPKAPAYTPVKAGVAFGATLAALGVSTWAVVKLVKSKYGKAAAANVKALFKKDEAQAKANAKPAPRAAAKPAVVGFKPNRNAGMACAGGQCGVARGGCANGRCGR